MGWLDTYEQGSGAAEILSLAGGADSNDPTGIIFNVMSRFLAGRRQEDEEKQQRYLQQSMQQAMEDRIVGRLKKEAGDTDEETDDRGEDIKPIAPPVVSQQFASYTPAVASPTYASAMAKPAISLGQQIAGKESAGDHKAFNPAGGGEGAVGKYQFRWNLWKDKIATVTGVKDKNAFLNDPGAQENFYSWYEQHELMPAASRIKVYNNSKYSDDQLARLVHFKGEAGAKEWLTKGIDRTQAGNMPIDKYLKQSGGVGTGIGTGPAVAITPQQQYRGLNNDKYDELLFPMKGHQVFRGLDNGQPVLVKDSAGRSGILYGPDDTMNTYGTVKEHRLNSGWLDKYK